MEHEDRQPEPVFWWWEEDAGARVVLLTDEILVLSSPLGPDQLVALEQDRRTGDVLGADFGACPLTVHLNEVVLIRYVPAEHRLLLGLDDRQTTCAIEPPPTAAGVAAGVFDVLHERLAPDQTPLDTVQEVADSAAARLRQRELRLMAGLGAVGLVCLGMALTAAEGSRATGPLSGLRQALNDLFVQVGPVPACVAFVAMLGLQLHRMRRTSVPEIAAGTRVLELEIEPGTEVHAAAFEHAGDFDRPLLAPLDDDDPLAGLLANATTSEAAVATAAVATTAVDPSPALPDLPPPPPPPAETAQVAPAVAGEPAPTIEPEPVAEVAEPELVAEVAEPELVAEVAEPELVAEVAEPELVAEVAEPAPTIEPELVAEVAEPEPVAEVAEPEPVGWSPPEPEPAVEPVSEPEPVGWSPPEPEPAAETESEEPESVGWSPPEVAEPEPAAAAASPGLDSADVDPDSAFGEILTREPPRPAWATAPEPVDETVAPGVADAAEPVDSSTLGAPVDGAAAR